LGYVPLAPQADLTPYPLEADPFLEAILFLEADLFFFFIPHKPIAILGSPVPSPTPIASLSD
jgi:hypothetical protein